MSFKCLQRLKSSSITTTTPWYSDELELAKWVAASPSLISIKPSSVQFFIVSTWDLGCADVTAFCHRPRSLKASTSTALDYIRTKYPLKMVSTPPRFPKFLVWPPFSTGLLLLVATIQPDHPCFESIAESFVSFRFDAHMSRLSIFIACLTLSVGSI